MAWLSLGHGGIPRPGTYRSRARNQRSVRNKGEERLWLWINELARQLGQCVVGDSECLYQAVMLRGVRGLFGPQGARLTSSDPCDIVHSDHSLGISPEPDTDPDLGRHNRLWLMSRSEERRVGKECRS